MQTLDIEERRYQLQLRQFELNKQMEVQRRETAYWEVEHARHQMGLQPVQAQRPEDLAVEKAHERMINFLEVHIESLNSNTKVNQRQG